MMKGPAMGVRFCLALTWLCAAVWSAESAAEPSAAASDKQIAELYDRMADDLKKGKPIVATVYVALCDNDSQGIIPTRNRSICKGDRPEANIYWGSSGGIKGHLRSRKWKRVFYESYDSGLLAVKGVWRKTFLPGGQLRARGVTEPFPFYIVGLGYRGERIRDALVDYLHAVGRDERTRIHVSEEVSLDAGGASHIVGYVGHDYFMDEADPSGLYAEAKGASALHKGVFGLSCASDHYFRPAIQRRNTHVLALNTQLTYPSAFIIAGIARAVAAGKDHKGIHKEAARAFAEGQKKSVGTMLRALAWGDKEIGVSW